ncbi:lung seven transmembrane receptor [Gregarina niphandrodes]|uniref:Lung seven transmembrane receptor n=1 Tax=Gregarina niphandrodes TaxID=110365 RepID=A0A023BCA7_GRENI|nr:lung seven transmembrane receptor [Gregarina niphandrodes]EZG82142.1 lung seven transmembrane receptor [Gregarina niphandrodes]|eukprot:XP_011129027.1 lung seven transmembrane receptor [Gregarina niphandrodes]
MHVDLRSVKLADPHTLVTVMRAFVYAKPSADDPGMVPSIGWGLWDSPYPTYARGVMSRAQLKVSGSLANKYEGVPPVWLTMMKSEDFWGQFVPYQNSSHFCCTDEDVEAGDCGAKRQLRLPRDIRSRVLSAPVALSATRQLVTDAAFPLSHTGVYYLLLANCMDRGDKVRDGDQLRGDVYIEGTHGFLSGVDVPKLHLYFSMTMLWSVLVVWWMVAIHSYQEHLHFIHNFLSLLLSVVLFEQLVSYITYSWENDSSQGAGVIIKFVQVAATGIKNTFVGTLLLLLCLGVYSVLTKPLVPHLKIKVWLLATTFFTTDLLRNTLNKFHTELNLGVTTLVLASLPLTICAAGGAVWGWSNLHTSLYETRKQMNLVKETMLSKLRRILVVGAGFFITCLAAQTCAYLNDPENVWKYEWLYTDGAPGILFYFTVACIAIIIRPSLNKEEL